MFGALKQKGFTIIELLIVIVVVAILAAVTVSAYNGVTARAEQNKRNTDMAAILKAIHAARNATGRNLGSITGSHWSVGSCNSAASNPSATEPRNLPTTHSCWTRYYTLLTNLSAASGINLQGLRSGDARGNPYTIDENEGEAGDYCRTDGNILYYTGNGITTASGPAVPKYFLAC